MKKRKLILTILILATLCSCTSKENHLTQNVDEMPVEKEQEDEHSIEKKELGQDFINQLTSENERPPEDMGKDIPKEKIKSFSPSTTGIESASGIAVVDDRILVSDQKQHCLFVLDLEGNVLEKLGRQGTGPMEFSRPGRIIWREEEQLYYVLDRNNRRIQLLSSSFQYKDEIDLDVDEIYGEDLFHSVAMDMEGNLYFSHLIANLDNMHIYRLSKDKILTKTKENFYGSLVEKDGAVYAVEMDLVRKTGSMDYFTFGGQTSFYQMKQDTMEKIADFPYKYAPDDMVWIGDTCYMVSKGWRMLQAFSLRDGKFHLEKSLTPQMDTPDGFAATRYSLDTDGQMFYIASTVSGTIYVAEP